jgi:cytochrome c peroxidase
LSLRRRCLLAGLCLSLQGYAQAFDWRLPPGFPQPAVPADNPMSVEKVALGARLFREPRLSSTGQYACVNCHQPQRAYTDGRAQAIGATGELTQRSAMSLANVAYNPAYTWTDSSVHTLEAQMLQPLFNEHPIEMGLKGREAPLVASLAADAEYASEFAAAFPADAHPVSIANLVKAIATFERTLISGRSAFDRYVFDDDQQALSAGARRGMALFYSARSGCAQCHFGLTFSGPINRSDNPVGNAQYANNGLGRMRVPTLRNIAVTAPYMHDGSLPTLEAVIEHYSMNRRIRALNLSAAEKQDLLAFLNSLGDQEFQGASAPVRLPSQ